MPEVPMRRPLKSADERWRERIDAKIDSRPDRVRRWWEVSTRFEYGVADTSPVPIPDGHPGAAVGRFSERVQCRTCFAICMADAEIGIWVDAAETHAYPFGKDPAETPGMAFMAYLSAEDDPVRPPALPEPEPEPEPETPRADAADWRAAKGIRAVPRHLAPSRIDRSAEYAKRNRKLRNERAMARDVNAGRQT